MSEMELEAKISQGLKITHRKIVEQHRRDNQPLIFSENGVVKQVDPFTVEISVSPVRTPLPLGSLRPLLT